MWKERLEKLPLILAGVAEDNQCFEEEREGVQITATHEFMPFQGAVYCISLFGGEVKVREIIARELISDLGPALFDDITNPKIWFYIWESPVKEIPETLVHQRLGREKIKEICQQFGLSENEEEIIDEIIAVFAIFMRNTEKRIQFVEWRLNDLKNERKEAIISALLEIMQQFAFGGNS